MLELVRTNIQFDDFKTEFEPHYVEEANQLVDACIHIVRSENDSDESDLLRYDEKAPQFPLAQTFAYTAEQEFKGDLARLYYQIVYYKRKFVTYPQGKYFEGKDRFYTCLQGEATIRVGKLQEPVRAGDMWWLDVTKEQSILNTGKSNLIGLVVDLHESEWRSQWT